MAETPSTTEDKIRSFWDRYIQRLYESGVNSPFDRWMVVRAEHYLAAHPDRRLADQTPADVNTYLADLGRKSVLKLGSFARLWMLYRNCLSLLG
jgi:hypothetical protein